MIQLPQTIKKRLKNLEKRHRLVITDEQNKTEMFATAYNRKLYIALASVAAVILIAGTYLLTAHTFIRYTIPGYPDQSTKEAAIENLLKIDSLERVIETWAFQIANIQRVVTGMDPLQLDTASARSRTDVSSDTIAYAKEDSLLRAMIKEEERFSLAKGRRHITQIEGTHFYPPVKGVIANEYNPAAGHPYIDITLATNTTVCATLDGTVISAGWNDDTGYTIYIQHPNDIISVYKHTEKLLVKTGDKVTAGSPVALVGSAGSPSTNVLLHFELWHKGEAINPAQYMTF
ncbi:MAG: M23 family metallopeptidase [Bacteroidales bacterium]|nr:M23 family metallopeptidase [Bacteroidales bacterium]